MTEAKKDKRVVYGASCVWWDTIDKIATITSLNGIIMPCCPVCQGMLMEMGSLADWYKDIDKYELDAKEPGYRKFVDWMRGKHFDSISSARELYEKQIREEPAVEERVEPITPRELPERPPPAPMLVYRFEVLRGMGGRWYVTFEVHGTGMVRSRLSGPLVSLEAGALKIAEWTRDLKEN